MPGRNRKAQLNQARRHFLGLAAALAATILPSSMAKAARRKAGHPGKGAGRGHKCVLRGTSIMTPAGAVHIENLGIGDLVNTVRGDAVAVKWIGRHIYRRNGPTWNKSVVPIRVARFALDEHTPSKDLYLSPGHALLIDGMLIKASDLVNGTSIAPVSPADRDTIEYFHIVFDTHEVVFAEGAPVESCLLEADSYEGFTNFAEFARLYPADRHATMTPFAPIVGYNGTEHLKALLRLGSGGLLPVHSPLRDACDRIAARAKELVG